jgi:KAP family P-loop domain
MSKNSTERKLTGHDSPLSNPDDDLYGRLSIAEEIYRICATAPNHYSTRVGLYGPWGSGKTSVLNFLRVRAEADSNLVVAFSASGIADINSLWVNFYSAFKEAAGKTGVNASLVNRFKQTAKNFSERGGRLAPAARGLVDLFGVGFGAVVEKAIKSAAGSAANIKIDDDFIESLRDRVNTDPNKRIIVFIDDLDRADPKVVPLMLLALRELLDIPGFCFVIAIDYDVVTRALGAYNQAWKERGGVFLEKIIDFAIVLPMPTEAQIKKLALHEFENCCSPNSYVPPLLITRLLPELPSNPRQLKLIARILGTYKKQVARHHKDELDIAFMVRMAALKVISSTLAENVHCDIRLLSYANFHAEVTDPTQPEKEFDANISAWVEERVKRVPDLDDLRRVEAKRILVRIVNAKLQDSSAEKLFYTSRVLLGRATFTRKEFENLVTDFRKNSNDTSIAIFVDQWSKVHALAVHVDLINAALSKYLDTLRLAKTTYSLEESRAYIVEAGCVLKLLQAIWRNFLKQPFEWFEKMGAFRDIQKDLIGGEKRPNPGLISMFKALHGAAEADQEYLSLLDVIEMGEPSPSFLEITGNESDIFPAQQLFSEISPTIAKVVGRKLTALASTSEIRSMYMSQPLAWVVRSPHGPLLSKPEFSQSAIAEANLVTSVSAKAENAFSYLAAIHSGRTYDDGASLAALAANVPLSKYLWQTIIQVQPNEDAINSLCIYRDKLVRKGMATNIVVWPKWFRSLKNSES